MQDSFTLIQSNRLYRLPPFAMALFMLLFFSAGSLKAQKARAKMAREYIQIRVYHAADSQQLANIDQYLHHSYVPALHGAGFRKIGVFTAIANDTAKDKQVYVLIPMQSLLQLEQLASVGTKTIADTTRSGTYASAAYNRPPYFRFETILLQAFAGAPKVTPSAVKGNLSERVYELRSYESATEALHQNKVQMFNTGEIELFQRLGFNAVFYGQVMAGSRMPNLMYMTSFPTKASRDEHWKAFGSDPAWKVMSSKPEYQHNVSKIEIIFLRPAKYSEL